MEYLYERLLKAEPQEVVVIREALLDHKEDLTERLWALAGESEERSGRNDFVRPVRWRLSPPTTLAGRKSVATWRQRW